MIKLFWCAKTRAARALWMIEETGVEYELAKVDLHNPAHSTDPDLLSASPLGKVPAIVDGEVKLCDSAAICLYLADRYPDAGLAPAVDDPKRGKYLFWTLFTTTVLEPAIGEKFSGSQPKKYHHGWSDYETMMEVLLKEVSSGEWILGDRFSAADVMIGSSLNFLNFVNMMPDDEAAKAYHERCIARPAFQKMIEIDSAGSD